MSWKKVKLGELLTESRVPCDNPNPDRRIKGKINFYGKICSDVQCQRQAYL